MIPRKDLLARLYQELARQIDQVHQHYDAALITAHSRAVLDLARAIAILEGKPQPERIEAGPADKPTQRLLPAELPDWLREDLPPLDKP